MSKQQDKTNNGQVIQRLINDEKGRAFRKALGKRLGKRQAEEYSRNIYLKQMEKGVAM